MKVKATEKFKKEAGIENNYQGLRTDQFYKLKAGGIIDLEDIPEHLIENKFIEKIKAKVGGK